MKCQENDEVCTIYQYLNINKSHLSNIFAYSICSFVPVTLNIVEIIFIVDKSLSHKPAYNLKGFLLRN